FATSGGSSITGSVKQLKRLYPKIEWEEGRLFNGGTANVAGWSKQIIEKL
ncbi:flavodoxin, partial [Parabacteroides johnsonii]